MLLTVICDKIPDTRYKTQETRHKREGTRRTRNKEEGRKKKMKFEAHIRVIKVVTEFLPASSIQHPAFKT
jgi:hypothetical protein